MPAEDNRRAEETVPPSLTPKKIIFQNAVNRSKTIFPANLLAFFIGAPVIGDPDLIDPAFFPRDLGSNLRFKSEPVFLNRYGLDDFAAKSFIASFHVGQIQIGEEI